MCRSVLSNTIAGRQIAVKRNTPCQAESALALLSTRQLLSLKLLTTLNALYFSRQALDFLLLQLHLLKAQPLRVALKHPAHLALCRKTHQSIAGPDVEMHIGQRLHLSTGLNPRDQFEKEAQFTNLCRLAHDI